MIHVTKYQFGKSKQVFIGLPLSVKIPLTHLYYIAALRRQLYINTLSCNHAHHSNGTVDPHVKRRRMGTYNLGISPALCAIFRPLNVQQHGWLGGALVNSLWSPIDNNVSRRIFSTKEFISTFPLRSWPFFLSAARSLWCNPCHLCLITYW